MGPHSPFDRSPLYVLTLALAASTFGCATYYDDGYYDRGYGYGRSYHRHESYGHVYGSPYPVYVPVYRDRHHGGGHHDDHDRNWDHDGDHGDRDHDRDHDRDRNHAGDHGGRDRDHDGGRNRHTEEAQRAVEPQRIVPIGRHGQPSKQAGEHRTLREDESRDPRPVTHPQGTMERGLRGGQQPMRIGRD